MKQKRTPADIAADKYRKGRPPQGDESRNVLFAIKMTRSENRLWRKQAAKEGKTFGSWLLEPRRAEMEKGKRHG